MKANYGLLKRIVLQVIIFLVSIIVGFDPMDLLPRFFLLSTGAIATVLLAYSAEIDVRHALEQKLKVEKRRFAELAIKNSLRDLINSLGTPLKARSFIYLKDTVTNKLKVVYQCGMDGSPDAELEFEQDCGWVWDVWKNQDPISGDLGILAKNYVINKWNLTKGQYRAIEATGYKSFLYVPICHPKHPDITIGILGCDSTGSFLDTHLDTQTACLVAYQFAAILSRYIVYGRLI